MIKALVAGVLLLMAALPGWTQTGQEQEFEDDAVWIDVRSPRDYEQGHIEGAINIPHTDISHRISDFVTDLYQPVHLYGSTGTFAGLALEILMEMGFQYVVNEGSYEAVLERRKNQ